jgi:hypothetical protein
MTKNQNQQPIKGTAPSEDDEFYISWGRETLKHNLVFANEVLRQLVTLNVALLGGSIIFLDNIFVDSNIKVFALLSFFFSLIISFIGIMPYARSVDLRVADDIREHKESALKHKLYYLGVAGGLIGLGFIAIFIGLFTHRP